MMIFFLIYLFCDLTYVSLKISGEIWPVLNCRIRFRVKINNSKKSGEISHVIANHGYLIALF